ncbi:class I SAM-dependent RNA methyltransferase [Glycomyces endophyticus]|uniref:Class I SAM-dependent RNA methyltransferase n=1 Tax=Glycomyces endophyticus TaxID=480996 RepID=A0ABN2HMF1_9ACTN
MALSRRAARPRAVEVVFLPGLRRSVADEIRSLLPRVQPAPVPGREDALRFAYPGPLERLTALRTAVAAFTVLTFGVARPAQLLHADHLRRIRAAASEVDGVRSFRIEAAGSGSAVFGRLAEAIAGATGLAHRRGDGDLVLRFRPCPDADGWDVLVRTSARPISARAWRVADYPGAVNATIAAAMVRMLPHRPEDRFLNLMSGSGTLLVERLLAGRARAAVGVERSAAANAACRANLAAAGVAAELAAADVASPDLLGGRRFEAVAADPPWGTRTGSHETNAELYGAMLDTAHRLAAPGGVFAVLTHEVRLMERLLREHRAQWEPRAVHQVFQKGHHPRIHVLHRR